MKPIRFAIPLFAAAVFGFLATGCSSVPKDYADPEGAQYEQAGHQVKLWREPGFDFAGYDQLLVTEVKPPEKLPEKEEEVAELKRMQELLRGELTAALKSKNVVKEVTPGESPAAGAQRMLKFENTIVGYYEGATAARILVGFGAGHPWIMVRGVITDLATGKPVLRYVAKRGYEGMDTWAGDETVLRQSIHDLATDVTEILSRVQQHKPLK